MTDEHAETVMVRRLLRDHPFQTLALNGPEQYARSVLTSFLDHCYRGEADVLLLDDAEQHFLSRSPDPNRTAIDQLELAIINETEAAVGVSLEIAKGMVSDLQAAIIDSTSSRPFETDAGQYFA